MQDAISSADLLAVRPQQPPQTSQPRVCEQLWTIPAQQLAEIVDRERAALSKEKFLHFHLRHGLLRVALFLNPPRPGAAEHQWQGKALASDSSMRLAAPKCRFAGLSRKNLMATSPI
jgi:hypothetical protein